jgi:hypothetical protein
VLVHASKKRPQCGAECHHNAVTAAAMPATCSAYTPVYLGINREPDHTCDDIWLIPSSVGVSEGDA